MTDETDDIDRSGTALERLVPLVQQEYSLHPLTLEYITFSSTDIDLDAVAFALTDLGFTLDSEEERFCHESMPILIGDNNVAVEAMRLLAGNFSAADGLCSVLVKVHGVEKIDVLAISEALSDLNYNIRQGEFYRSGQKAEVASVACEVVDKLFPMLSRSGMDQIEAVAGEQLETSHVFDPSVSGSPQPETASQRDGLQAVVDGINVRAVDRQLARAPVAESSPGSPDNRTSTPVGGGGDINTGILADLFVYKMLSEEEGGDINTGILAAMETQGQEARTLVASEAAIPVADSPEVGAGLDTQAVTQIRPGTEYIPSVEAAGPSAKTRPEGNGTVQPKDSVPGVHTLAIKGRNDLEARAASQPPSRDSVEISQPPASSQQTPPQQDERTASGPSRPGYQRSLREGRRRQEVDIGRVGRELAQEKIEFERKAAQLTRNYETRNRALDEREIELRGRKTAQDEYVARTVAGARKETRRNRLYSAVLAGVTAVLGAYAFKSYEDRKDLEGKLGKTQTASYKAGYQAGRKAAGEQLRQEGITVKETETPQLFDFVVVCGGQEMSLEGCITGYNTMQTSLVNEKAKYMNHCGTYDDQKKACSNCGEGDTTKITDLEKQYQECTAQLNRCTAQNGKLRQRPESCPEAPVCPPAPEQPKVLHVRGR